MTDRMPVLLDCDTGIDDAVALLYLLGHPGVELVGITTVFGNITAAVAARNSRQVLALAGREGVPIAVGADQPLRRPRHELGTEVHGSDGLGGYGDGEPLRDASSLAAPAFISDLARRYAGELRIVATAAQTNLAHALAADPDLPARVRHVTIMGGAVEVPGNVTPVAEANIVHDPEAAQQVISAGWRTDLVPLDVTLRERLTDGHRERLAAADSPAARFVAGITDHYFDFYAAGTTGERSAPCHDALAAAIATGEVVPKRFPEVRLGVDPASGATLVEPGPPNCRVALETAGDFGDRLVDYLIARTTRSR